MKRPPRWFFDLVLAAECVLAISLGIAVAILVLHRVSSDPGNALFNPQGPEPPASAVGLPAPRDPRSGTTPAEPLTTPSQEAPAPQPMPNPAPTPGTEPNGTRIDPAVACATTWQVTRAVPAGPCVQPNGATYRPVQIDCTDGRTFVTGQPGDQLLAGWAGGRLEAMTLDQVAELAAQCKG